MPRSLVEMAEKQYSTLKSRALAAVNVTDNSVALHCRIDVAVENRVANECE